MSRINTSQLDQFILDFEEEESKAVFFMCGGFLYVRAIPAKALFKSTMVHEVVNRGDVFAVNLHTGTLTILSGSLVPTFVEVEISAADKK